MLEKQLVKWEGALGTDVLLCFEISAKSFSLLEPQFSVGDMRFRTNSSRNSVNTCHMNKYTSP